MGTHAYFLAIKVLAAVGGAVVGGLFVGLLIRFLAKWFSPRAVPRPVLTAVRLLGGVAAGLAVWLMVNTEGGGLGGAGAWPFGGRGEGSGTAREKVVAAGPTAISPSTNLATGRSGGGVTLRVILLGGKLVSDERFYVIDGEPRRLTLPELKKAVKERQETGGVKKVEIVIYSQSVAAGHPAVRNLRQWAEENNLAVATVREEGDLESAIKGSHSP